ncbi:inverse autotransporter beta domain-containing protein [Citrobacter braakii]|uniref:inverse autotransporter beta domain-containing protein n=1 Tax=Citrobacter braakii TaxID=57706 RepID=UPI004039696D
MNPKLTRVTAQFCLVLQLAAGGIMPVASASQFIKNNEHHSLFSSRTALYTLKQGDTINSVAKQFNLTPGELKKLNEFRTYSKPFEQLGAGDEVDVPVATSRGTKDTLPADTSIEASKPDAEELFIASSMSTMGGMLDSGDVTHQAAGMARSAAVGAAGGEVEDWLSQFGTAKLRLNVDDDFHLDGSAVDLLVPLYDSNNHVLFTQWGYRNKDSRNTINLGLGARTFQGNWMFGVNTFWDNDMTGHNRRIGFGLEAWTDYLKLSANSYSGITDWHQSRDFADYDERPADGFDIRAEGYLPAYPQLGARVMYEQYTGDEVALFGKDNRQKDPKAVTLGLNYTPVPLLTVGVDHRQGQSGQNDTQINLGVNYRFGMPWLQQISPDAVASTRTLAGSRYDLVDRNNDIVLEYKKQTLIRLSLPQSLRGKAGDTDHVTATVTAKYGTDHVEWNTGELLAAGGMAKEVSKQVLEITYPPFKSEGSNTYRLSAVAYDAKGNTSNQGTTEISVSEPDAGITDGNLKFTVDGAKADGVATDEVVALVTDNAGNGVPGMAVVFTADNGAKIVGGSTVTTDAGGKATITLTNTRAGDVMVTARINSSEVSTKGSFVADAATSAVNTLDSDVVTQLADGTRVISFTATLKDGSGNPVPNAAVDFSTSSSTAVLGTAAVTDADGKTAVTLKDTVAESVTVTAKSAANAADSGKTKDVTFTADAATSVVSTLDSDVVTQLADGTRVITFTATLKDGSGNPAPNAAVDFSTGSSTAVLSTAATTDTDGKTTVTLKDTVAESVTVTAKSATNAADSGQTKDVTFTADAATSVVSTLDSDVVTQLADGISVITFIATLKDSNGNPVPNVAVNFTTGSSTAVLSTAAATDADGKTTVTLKDTVAEPVTVTAKSAANAGDSGKTKDVTFIEPPPVPMSAPTRVKVNGEEFAIDSGFPKTGFDGAEFQFEMDGNAANNSDYTWTVKSGSWVSVDPVGKVTFTGEGNNSEVTITATPKTGGSPQTFSFRLSGWFIHDSTRRSGTDADEWCAAQPGYATPPHTQMVNASKIGSSSTRVPGGPLWAEWGDMPTYGWPDGYYWAGDMYDISQRYEVALAGGGAFFSGPPGLEWYTVCSKNL